MSIFVYVETTEGKIKKASYEATSYARNLADKKNDDLIAITINLTDDPELLYSKGVNKILNIQDDNLNNFSPNLIAKTINDVFKGGIIVFSHSSDASAIAPILSAIRNSAIISNILTEPTSLEPFTVKRKAFSAKAIEEVKTTSDELILTVLQNSFGIKDKAVSGDIENISVNISENDRKENVERIEKSSGKINLKEADIVVSAGRGMKSPDNWAPVEELAELLGAATACSKPVSDIGWRSHSEHVGQTGKTVAPNLYIAIGISGAIQHLAGVNGSKTIVVINNDPEAPFFKAADYGVVGDLFEVLPNFIQKIKEFKS